MSLVVKSRGFLSHRLRISNRHPRNDQSSFQIGVGTNRFFDDRNTLWAVYRSDQAIPASEKVNPA
jgi:hypothetical protein